VLIEDEDQLHVSCTGVPPRHAETLLDGHRVGEVEIPCTTELRAPARRFEIAFVVPAGRHTLRLVDRRTELPANKTLGELTLSNKSL
jgi:hypothetical protein